MASKATKWTGPVGNARVYVYDAETGECLRRDLAWMGNGEAPIRDGVRYMDARTAVSVVDLVSRKLETITGADWPDRPVAVKFWTPDGSEWWALVEVGSDGWQGNRADGPSVTRAELGTARRMRAVTRRNSNV